MPGRRDNSSCPNCRETVPRLWEHLQFCACDRDDTSSDSIQTMHKEELERGKRIVMQSIDIMHLKAQYPNTYWDIVEVLVKHDFPVYEKTNISTSLMRRKSNKVRHLSLDDIPRRREIAHHHDTMCTGNETTNPSSVVHSKDNCVRKYEIGVSPRQHLAESVHTHVKARPTGSISSTTGTNAESNTDTITRPSDKHKHETPQVKSPTSDSTPSIKRQRISNASNISSDNTRQLRRRILRPRPPPKTRQTEFKVKAKEVNTSKNTRSQCHRMILRESSSEDEDENIHIQVPQNQPQAVFPTAKQDDVLIVNERRQETRHQKATIYTKKTKKNIPHLGYRSIIVNESSSESEEEIMNEQNQPRQLYSPSRQTTVTSQPDGPNKTTSSPSELRGTPPMSSSTIRHSSTMSDKEKWSQLECLMDPITAYSTTRNDKYREIATSHPELGLGTDRASMKKYNGWCRHKILNLRVDETLEYFDKNQNDYNLEERVDAFLSEKGWSTKKLRDKCQQHVRTQAIFSVRNILRIHRELGLR